MNRGITFQIPHNNHEANWLTTILKPVDCAAYNWLIGAGEEYRIYGTKLPEEMEPLFPEGETVLAGGRLQAIMDACLDQFIIFLDLKAFPIGTQVSDQETYADFRKSACEIVVLIVDCTYVTIYVKDEMIRDQWYQHAKALGVEALDYITDDNDFRTGLSVW